MARERQATPKTAKQIEAELHKLFARDLSDDELLQHLEPLANEWAFAELIHVWGPELYQRNAVKFRPFILPRMNTWSRVVWKGKHAKALNAWFVQVGEADDVELFRILYAWKISPGQWSQPDEKQWKKDLCKAFEDAGGPAERARVLTRYDLQLPLDQETALALYETDPDAARDFIQRHVFPQWGQHKLWSKLLKAARDNGDEQLQFHLYRRQVGAKQWEKDILKLCGEIDDAQALVAALEQHHPEAQDIERMHVYHQLLTKRGEDVLPYVTHHLQGQNWWWGEGAKGVKKLVALARKKNWLDLWSTLIRTCCTTDDFNKEIADILDNSKLSDEEVNRLLRLLPGPMWEFNAGRRGFAATHHLTDKNAVELHKRFPELLNGPFRPHLTLQLWGESGYTKLLARLKKSEDTTLIDYLASQAIVLAPWYGQALPAFVTSLAEHYEKLVKDPEEFARRLVGVLGQLSAVSVGRQYSQLVKGNPLAKLFFEESHDALQQAPAQVRDLLESPNGYVQALALRLLARGEGPMREVAANSLDLLLPCLLRPLHRRTHRWAFQALLHAATTPENARLIVERGRQAFDFQDPKYPREELLGVVAQLLQRYPELRRPSEQPHVYERTA
jgi:hypothetical protein